MELVKIYSFENWCIDNNRGDIIERWDYDLNNLTPSDVSYKSNKKYWFKCPRGIHKSEIKNIQYISAGKQSSIYCEECLSFGQFIIDKFGIDYLNEIWHKDNSIDPMRMRKNSSKKAKFICQKGHIYDMSLYSFSKGCNCPYCSHKIRCVDQSFGGLWPKVFDLWSNKNTRTPYDYTEKTNESVWFKCKNGIHDDFIRRISSMVNDDFSCPECKKKESIKKRIDDLTGKKFGMLSVIEIDEPLSEKRNRVYWKCICDCGNEKSVSAYHIKHGDIKSCGCLQRLSGERSPSWRGGKTSDLQNERNSNEYGIWRNMVYEKDWYTCQCCGAYSNIVKNAHHIVNFSDNKDLRYDVDNGITLCEDCHYSTKKGSFHNIYGTRNNTENQLEEYINSRRIQLGIDKSFSLDGYRSGDILKPKTRPSFFMEKKYGKKE